MKWIIIILTLLCLSTTTLFILNITNPETFRWGCVECNTQYLWNSKCNEDNCFIYHYSLHYESLNGYVDNKCYNVNKFTIYCI